MNEAATTEAERALIGSVLKNPSQFQTLRDEISADDIREIGLRACWEAFGEISERGLQIDQVTVGDELDRAGRLQDVVFGCFAGRPALSAIRDEGRAGNAESYSKNVLDYSAKRKIMQILNDGAGWSLNGRRSADIQADIVRLISDVNTPGQRADEHTQTLGEAVSSAYDRTDLAAQGKVQLLYTDFIDLDKLLHGLEGGDFLILAARPGQGKTALATNIAYNVSLKEKRVAFFILEMQNQQIAMRLIQLKSSVSFGRQKDGKLREEEWPLYTHAIGVLENLPIYLCDLPAIKVRDMRRTLRKLEAKYGKMDLVIVDYLQLAGADDENSRSREQEVSKVARGLKNLAKEFGIPVLACAQLSRAVEARSSGRPVLSDLRESGELEQAADVVMFIYRPDQYEKDTAKQNVVEIIVAKQRNGPVGSIELIFRSSLTKFENAVTRKITLDEPLRQRADIDGD